MGDFNLLVYGDQIIGKNKKIWKAVGLDSVYALVETEQGQHLLKRMQEKGTGKWIRNHHALSYHEQDGFVHSGGEVYHEDENGNPVYDFSRMNRIYQTYLEHGMKPIVELDYLPDELSSKKMGGGPEERMFDNRSYPTDWDKWSNLLKAFMKNLEDTFGLEEIRTWYFEVWNEPDGWPVEDWPMFHRLYDVFVDAVLSIDEQLKVGGPGTYSLDFLHNFLEHVSNGTNYVTGQKGTRIDFVSHHIYGMSGSWLPEYPLIMPTVQRFNQELAWLNRLLHKYPKLNGIELHINEWGVSSHYEKSVTEYPALEVRNSEFSAAFFVKMVDCLNRIAINHNINLGMLLYWGFSVEDSKNLVFAGHRSLSTAPNLPKPILTAFEMMALMGDEFIAADGLIPGGKLGCIAAREAQNIQLMFYGFDESEIHPVTYQGDYKITGIADGNYRMKTMILDLEHHNTYRKWQEKGSPRDVKDAVFDEIRKAGELSWDEEECVSVKDGSFSSNITLTGTCIKLVVLEKE